MSDEAPTPNQMPGAGGETPQQTPQQLMQPESPPQPEQPPQQPDSAPETPQQPDNQPPWEKAGQDFDPDKAWKLIQNLRGEVEESKAKAQPLIEQAEQRRRDEQTEHQRLSEDLTAAGDREAAWRSQAVNARIDALSAGRFVDTDLVQTLVGGDADEYMTRGQIDGDKITAKLDQLAEAKPYLVAQQQPEGFRANRGQGQSGNGPVTPAQMVQHAESQQDWKAAGRIKAQQLIDMRNKQ